MKNFENAKINAQASLVLRSVVDKYLELIAEKSKSIQEIDVRYAADAVQFRGNAYPKSSILEKALTTVPAEHDKAGTFSILQAFMGALIGAEVSPETSYEARLTHSVDGCFDDVFEDALYDLWNKESSGLSRLMFNDTMTALIDVAAKSFQVESVTLEKYGDGNEYFTGHGNAGELKLASAFITSLIDFLSVGYISSRSEAEAKFADDLFSTVKAILLDNPNDICKTDQFITAVCEVLKAECWITSLAYYARLIGVNTDTNPLYESEQNRAKLMAERARIANEAAAKALAKFDRTHKD